jgi:alanine dehydrogenase
MIVGSTKENLSLEKRVSITPETSKNIINLGLKVIIENDYATHIGITDKEYEAVGVEIKSSSKEVLDNCNLLTKLK